MRAVVMALTLMAVLACAPARAVPSFDAVRRDWRGSESVLLDRHGATLAVLRTDARARRLDWVALADMSPALRNAIVFSEDQRFYAHAGIDWSAVGAAAWGNLWNTRTRGASTITMQLAGLLDDGLRPQSLSRSMTQKLGQAATALQLEHSWRKDQILEAYLNLVGYRGDLVGVAALSAGLFGKSASGLDAREAALTAALVRAPNAAPARVAERACVILKAQHVERECLGLRDYATLVLARTYALRPDAERQLAPHLASRLLKTPSRSTLTTTLDARLQRYARDTLRARLAELSERNVEDGAVLVLDNASGDVLAWVGSSGDLSDAADVDGVLAPRQAGSTLKPFLYELALEQRWLTAASILDDAPVNLAAGGGLYMPQNYDHDYKGPVSVRTALASSLNIPAVRAIVMATPERFHQRLVGLGFSLRESGDYYGYSLALGSADVTLAALTNAYRALANGGRYGPMRILATAPRVAGTALMDGGATYIVGDILSDRTARAVTFGLDSTLATRYWSAVKTGTSKDMRDNWCVGWTRRYTVGVWVGNASGASMWDVSGSSGAAPVWAAVMDWLRHRDGGAPGISGSMAPALPAGVLRRPVRFGANLEAARDELFLAGTEQAVITLADTPNRPIVAPTDGSIIALDPDIPPARQRLRIAAAHDVALARWRLDGKALASGREISWPLWPGRHRLELLGRDGRPIDSVGFEVRGARTLPGRDAAAGRQTHSQGVTGGIAQGPSTSTVRKSAGPTTSRYSMSGE